MSKQGGSTHAVVRRRVLAIGMYDSIHFARWLELFQHEDIDFLLFPSSPHRRIHSGLQELLKSAGPASYRFAPSTRFTGLPLWVLDRIFSNYFRSVFLSVLIRSFAPHIVHALELQNAGYLAARSFQSLGSPKPVLIATNYGSDIFWFSRKTRHEKRLMGLLAKVDRYAAECNRDVLLAKELGFGGEVLPVQPNAGGFDRSLLDREPLRQNDRKIVMVKGYHGWVGRAHIAIQALESISTELADYEIAVYSCNLSTKRLARKMAKRTGLNVTAYSKGALSHDDMVEKFSRSIIYVGLSLSDGVSTSMLEAMAMGAIPVQTNTACCDEWFSDTGVAIRNLTVQDVALGIQKAIGLALTTDSAIKNRETIRARASREEIAKQALTFYHL